MTLLFLSLVNSIEYVYVVMCSCRFILLWIFLKFLPTFNMKSTYLLVDAIGDGIVGVDIGVAFVM